MGYNRLWTIVVVGLAGMLIGASCQEKPVTKEALPEIQVKERTVNKIEPTVSREMEPKIFEAQVAGGFYPEDPQVLKNLIRGYLDQALKTSKEIKGDLLGIMVPHAGYPYSGPVAAFAFQAIRGRNYKRVVVLGPAHKRAFSVPALLDANVYRTPLGDIPIDLDGVKKLESSGAAQIDSKKFEQEHALEVELPFLQSTLGDFQLIPIMLSEPNPEVAKKLAKALHELFPGGETLFVASTDMSHDYPYEVAVAMDENALRLITALDADGLYSAYQAFQRTGYNPDAIKVGKKGRPEPDCMQLCGMGPVLTLMQLAKQFGNAQASVLDRRNSGDIVGDKNSRIVGYSAVAFTLAVERPRAGGENGHSGSTGDFINPQEKQELLKIARETLEVYLKDGTRKDFKPTSSKLQEPGAAFVTLKKHGDLRGCIGYMEPADPLWTMIRDRAIDAAVHDTRFEPVNLEELRDLTIEISILSPRVEVKDPLKEIVIGRDGVWLELGFNRGVFLPQVPVEQGWKTVEEYLDNLCRKAHIFEQGCWRSKDARIMRYTALVFSEKE